MSIPVADFAAEIGPQLDRLRLGVMRASVDVGMASGVMVGSGLDPDTFMVFAMLRNAYPDRHVPLPSFRAAYVYQAPDRFQTALSRIVDAGLAVVQPDETLTLSGAGREVIVRVRAVATQAVEGLWGTNDMPVLVLADRCLQAAATAAEADGAFHLVAPPHDEPGDSDATRLAERLTGLRWHRFDAHVAAWRSAGCTAESVAALEPGPVRDAIETSTNERAGLAYAELSADERTALLAGLRELT